MLNCRSGKISIENIVENLKTLPGNEIILEIRKTF